MWSFALETLSYSSVRKGQNRKGSHECKILSGTSLGEDCWLMVSGNRETREPESFIFELEVKGTEDKKKFPKIQTQGHYSLYSFYTLLFENNTGINLLGFPGGAVVKNSPANAGDTGDASSIPGLGLSPGIGNGNPFQYSCLENSMDRGAWQATVHGVSKNRT